MMLPTNPILRSALCFIPLAVAGLVSVACGSSQDPGATTTTAASVDRPSLADDPAHSQGASPEPQRIVSASAEPHRIVSANGVTYPDDAPAREHKKGPTIVPGPVTLIGGASVDDVRSVVDHNMASFALCYSARLAKRSDLNGNLTVALTIDPGGNVTNAKDASSDVGDTELVTCILQQMGKLHFTPFAAGAPATANVPLALRAGQ